MFLRYTDLQPKIQTSKIQDFHLIILGIERQDRSIAFKSVPSWVNATFYIVFTKCIVILPYHFHAHLKRST